MKRKVLRIPKRSALLHQSAYLSHELCYMLAHAASTVPGSTAPELVRTLIVGGGLREPHGLGSECPICYMPLEPHEALEHCRAQCGHYVHARPCMDEFRRHCAADSKLPTCPLCFAPWLDAGATVRTVETVVRPSERESLTLPSYTNYNDFTQQWRPKGRRARASSVVAVPKGSVSGSRPTAAEGTPRRR